MAMKSDQDEVISDINVVPLVDIILVVLIIFMVTAPMIMKPSINVNLPKAATGEQTNPTQLNITVTVDGGILLNGTIASEEEIRAKAVEQVATNPDVQAVIAADQSVPHGKVVSVLDLVKSSGVKKFAITSQIDMTLGVPKFCRSVPTWQNALFSKTLNSNSYRLWRHWSAS